MSENKVVKILSVAAARPNLVKIAPLVRAIDRFNQKALETLKNKPQIKHVLVHTGQHYDTAMSGQFFTDLGIPQPDYNLEVGSGSFAYQDGTTMMRVEDVLLREQPDWVVVVGDVNGTMATAVNARKNGFRVAHVEAGLRSRDWSMPEEINRVITDRVANRLFTTCRFADANLQQEGVAPELIRRVGNIMIDTLEYCRPVAAGLDVQNELAKVAETPVKTDILTPGKYIVLTMHRPAGVDNPACFRPIMHAFLKCAEKTPMVFPLHPRTRHRLEEFGILPELRRCKNIILTGPVPYPVMLALNLNAAALFTDSGGLQDESCVLGIPCFTLRENTERPVTLVENNGTSRLIGLNPNAISQALMNLPDRGTTRPERWDGHTAERIIDDLMAEFTNAEKSHVQSN